MNEANQCVFPNAPQCHAKSKRTGCQCRAPAVTGWKVCRFHGARGGQPSGQANSRYIHGHYTNEAIALRRMVGVLCREARTLSSTLI